MQQEHITYTVSDRVYGSPNVIGGSTVNYMPMNTGNVQPWTYVGSSDNYGYGFRQQKEIRNPEVFMPSPFIPQFTTPGVPIKSNAVQYENQNPGGSGVRGSPFVVNPSNATYVRPLATVQTGYVVQPANIVQPQMATFVQPVKSSFVQPGTTIYTQQQTSNYVQPALITGNIQQNQPLQKTSAKAQQETLGDTWAEQEFARPKYPKLYNNNAQYYRNLAPEEDPTGRKTCCSACCWVLIGLIGLLAIVFGVLCGLGTVFGDSFNFSLPSDWWKNKTETVRPTGTGEQVVPVKPMKPVKQITSVEPVAPVTPVTPIYPANIQISDTSTVSTTPTLILQPVTTPSQTFSSSISPTSTTPLTSTTLFSNSYGYDLGYQPTTVTTNDFNSVPLSIDPEQWSSMTVDPITAKYQ